ncbi:MAG: hotdog fold thioesterase, partial [Rhodocyclaceae bacterium]|nr:hotdog fold thioesterase [Rhodocyclaceae bacterium]
MTSPQPSEAEALDLARRVGAAMYAEDAASRDTLGMELVRCEPGHATMRMAVRPLHLNGHRICHGGFIFTLADSTFAYACNSRNHNTVANGCNIEFLRPAY